MSRAFFTSRTMLIVGEVKIRHSGDMGSGSWIATALYHRFPEQIVARVLVTTLLQRGDTVNDYGLACAEQA